MSPWGIQSEGIIPSGHKPLYLDTFVTLLSQMTIRGHLMTLWAIHIWHRFIHGAIHNDESLYLDTLVILLLQMTFRGLLMILGAIHIWCKFIHGAIHKWCTIFWPISLPTYPCLIFLIMNCRFHYVVSNFGRPTYLPKNWKSFMDVPKSILHSYIFGHIGNSTIPDDL